MSTPLRVLHEAMIRDLMSALLQEIIECELQILFFDQANAYRDEQYEEFRYGVRHDQILTMLETIKADIIVFKEGRMCKNKEGVLTHPNAFLRDYKKATGFEVASFEPVKVHPTEGVEEFNPVHLGQLYNPKKFAFLGSHCFDYSHIFQNS